MRVPDITGNLIIALILTEAISEIIVDSMIFSRIRLKLLGPREDRFLGKLFTCGYCMSVWVGVAMAYLFKIKGAFPYMGDFEPVIWGLILHRASNVTHVFLSFVMKMMAYTTVRWLK